MKRHAQGFGLLLSCLICGLALGQDQSFSVTDDIEMVRFVEPSPSLKGATATFSPDHMHYAVVTSRGILHSDETESTLAIFSTTVTNSFLTTTSAQNDLRPELVFTVKAVLGEESDSSYGTVISDLRWSNDSRLLYFVAEDSHGNKGLYRAELKGVGKVLRVAPEGYNVARYDFISNAIAFSGWHTQIHCDHRNRAPSDLINRDARDVTGESLKQILFPCGQPAVMERQLWLVRERQGHFRLVRIPRVVERDISWLPEAFSLSPKGDELIELDPVEHVPPGWESYQPASGFEHLRIESRNPGVVSPDNLWRLKTYSVVNLKSGASASLVSAPQAFALAYGGASRAVWSSDEERVLLTNTFLPLTGVDATEQTNRLKPCAVAIVPLKSRDVTCLLSDSALKTSSGDLRFENTSFGRSTDEVTLTLKAGDGQTEYRHFMYQNRRWQQDFGSPGRSINREEATSTKSSGSNSLSVGIKQALDESPVLWASNTQTGLSRQIWNPNPQLVGLHFGQASVYEWTDPGGRKWKGGLVKPVGYVAGRRYPLVIQIYNFDDSQFLADGMLPTAFAARAMASAGIVVLQIQRKMPHTYDLEEARANLDGIDSAIDGLSSSGLIDSERVGIVGFSASAWYVESALIQEPKRFAAATIAEGIDISYIQYRLWGVSDPTMTEEFERIIGAKPNGDGLSKWMEGAPGFHLDRVRTPLRIEAMQPTSVLGEWELYSSLRMQGKPVDFVYFPEGQHVHQRPLERFASQQGDVDWFRFWLQNYQDPDASKKSQYQLWESLRDLSRDYLTQVRHQDSSK
jgi:dipeptidyl aminopeptidase/acylaminoacyl peptidase